MWGLTFYFLLKLSSPRLRWRNTSVILSLWMAGWPSRRTSKAQRGERLEAWHTLVLALFEAAVRTALDVFELNAFPWLRPSMDSRSCIAASWLFLRERSLERKKARERQKERERDIYPTVLWYHALYKVTSCITAGGTNVRTRQRHIWS